MIILTIGTMFLLMLRMGMFDEYFQYREMQLLDEHIMQAYEDSLWEERMADFRKSHARLSGSFAMSLGRRR